jgi:hypothetical protein
MFEGVISLYAEVFGREAADGYRKRWSWSQERNLFPEQTFQWALLADSEIAGFVATMPLPYRVNGKLIVAHTPCDYMVHPDYRFHGIKLMRECFKAIPDCISCDDIPATIKVTEWLGAKQAGEMWRYARVLDARTLRRGRLAPVPGPLWAPVTLGLRVFDRLRLARPDKGIHVQTVSGFDEKFDRFFARISADAPASLARDSRFLNWRYGPDSPIAASAIAIVTDAAGELAGYSIYHNSKSKGRYGYVMDLQATGPDREQVATALLSHSVKRLRKAGAWVVQLHQAPTAHGLPWSLLKANGFKIRGRHVLLARLSDEGSQKAVESGDGWNYVYGDSEPSHSAI